MKIAKDMVVAIEYTIRNQEGQVVDTSEGRRPLVYLHGYQQIVPGVETAIDGAEAGATFDLEVPPGDAFGARDPNAILLLPRRSFPGEEEVEAGAMYRAYRPDGKPLVFSVIEVTDEIVVVDANHPLAGQTLQVNVAILSVRTATEAEREHKHVHTEETAGPPPGLA